MLPSARSPVGLTKISLFGTAWHLIGAIVCATVSLVLWDLASRPFRKRPTGVAPDKLPSRLLHGLLRLVVGLIFGCVALALVLLSVGPDSADAISIVVWLTALLVESLIGEDIRRAIAFRR